MIRQSLNENQALGKCTTLLTETSEAPDGPHHLLLLFRLASLGKQKLQFTHHLEFRLGCGTESADLLAPAGRSL
jgi:hypothetical protein